MQDAIKITKLQEQMKSANEKLDKLDKKLDKSFSELKEELSCYVRKEEFATVKSIVYGMVGAILTAFLSAVIYMVIK